MTLGYSAKTGFLIGIAKTNWDYDETTPQAYSTVEVSIHCTIGAILLATNQTFPRGNATRALLVATRPVQMKK